VRDPEQLDDGERHGRRQQPEADDHQVEAQRAPPGVLLGLAQAIAAGAVGRVNGRLAGNLDRRWNIAVLQAKQKRFRNRVRRASVVGGLVLPVLRDPAAFTCGQGERLRPRHRRGDLRRPSLPGSLFRNVVVEPAVDPAASRADGREQLVLGGDRFLELALGDRDVGLGCALAAARERGGNGFAAFPGGLGRRGDQSLAAGRSGKALRVDSRRVTEQERGLVAAGREEGEVELETPPRG
jgi:hypothetical protein